METLVGEALVGEGNEVAHIDLAIGSKGGPFETAFLTALAQPESQHTPLLAVLAPNLMAKPATLIVNKVSIKNASQATLMFGPAQAAVARAVTDSVADGIISKKDVGKPAAYRFGVHTLAGESIRKRSTIIITRPQSSP